MLGGFTPFSVNALKEVGIFIKKGKKEKERT